ATPDLPYSAPPLTDAPPTSTLAEETLELSQAIAALRTRHSPGEALQIIARYRGHFPQGALRIDVTRVAVEALQAAGRSEDAALELKSLEAATGESAALKALRKTRAP